MSSRACWSSVVPILFAISCREDDADSGTGGNPHADTATDAARRHRCPACGNARIDPGEDCDDGAESEGCDADCTFVECGDRMVNESAGEICEPTSDEPWDRCVSCDRYGAGLDGTFGSEWESLTPSPVRSIFALQSFHYSGAPDLYDFYRGFRYEIARDQWYRVGGDNPVRLDPWRNGAVDATTIWVPADEVMHEFDLATRTWTSLTGSIPDGDTRWSAAVFDGRGDIWYHGPNGLVRYDPLTDSASAEITHDYVYTAHTRLAYDPVGDTIVFGGFLTDYFLVYDIANDAFAMSSTNPGGYIRDNTCGDRSGGVYVGSDDDENAMYRYDVALDTWTELPSLPTSHDNVSTCVVSQDGYLYVGTSNGPGFYRLPLGKYAE
jgi:hypothetical protein